MRASPFASIVLVLMGCGGGEDAADSSDASTSPDAVVTTETGGDSNVADGGSDTAGPGDSSVSDSASVDAAADTGAGSKRGFPATSPWLSFYGTAAEMGDLAKAASTFRVLNIDVDPDGANFTKAQIATLRAAGKNRVISYLNLGSCENYRSYWNTVPSGFVSCKANTKAQRGAYDGYPDETWMNVGDADYQHLMVDHVAQRLADMGIDGFFLDNLEIVEHGTSTTNGPCDAACAQGGLDLVRKLREKFPDLLIVMQNATGSFTRTGKTGGVSFPTLLDGISHEEVYAPTYDSGSESELLAWKALALTPGGHPFFIATEDYVGNCSATTKAKSAYDKSRANGFTPYATDASGGQKVVCYWPF